MNARPSPFLRADRRTLWTCLGLIGWIGLSLVAGCAANAPQRIASEPPAAGVRLQVVPMTSPPLMVPASGGGLFIITAGRPAVGLFNLLQIAAGLPGAIERSTEATRALDAELRGASGWEPTQVIAEIVRERMTAGGAVVSVAPALKPMPGVGPVEVHALSNTWIQAVRAWRADDTPVADYAPLAANGLAAQVIEVAIRHYELAGGQLFLGIDLRAVDAASGRVVGRAFEHSLASLEPVNDSFADGGRRYKALFAAQADRLVGQCLRDMGLTRP